MEHQGTKVRSAVLFGRGVGNTGRYVALHCFTKEAVQGLPLNVDDIHMYVLPMVKAAEQRRPVSWEVQAVGANRRGEIRQRAATNGRREARNLKGPVWENPISGNYQMEIVLMMVCCSWLLQMSIPK